MIYMLLLLKTDGRCEPSPLSELLNMQNLTRTGLLDYISIYVYAKLNMNVSLPLRQ